MNSFFSFTAMVTYSKKGKVMNTLKWVSMDKLMIETDCPYLAPKALRKQENEPAFMTHLVDCISDVKGVSYDDVVRQTTDTAKCFFNLNK